MPRQPTSWPSATAIELIVAEPLAEAALGEGWTIQETVRGEDLLGARYEPPYPNVEGAHTVVSGTFVQMEDGTGIVHLAPAFGAEDLEVGLVQGWPVFKPVGDDGRFTDLAPEFIRGLFVKDADPVIVEDLSARGRLLRSGTILDTLSVLLALQDPPPLLRAHLLVRPHDGRQGAPPRGQRRRSTGTPITSSTGASATGWRTTSTGRSHASGTGARRCRSGGVRPST